MEGYRMVRYREQVTHEEMLRKLGLFSLGRRELRSDFIAAYKDLIGSYDRAKLFSAVVDVITKTNNINPA